MTANLERAQKEYYGQELGGTLRDGKEIYTSHKKRGKCIAVVVELY